MAIGKNGAVLRQFQVLFGAGTLGDLADGQLLERFATGWGEDRELAFAILVERHGPMVLRVCRGVLSDPHDAQDAFQATFLVLVGKARSLWVHDSLGPWLYQVAYRTAKCARSSAARRNRLERNAVIEEAVFNEIDPMDELGQILHEEIQRLPERYRAPLILCDLEGRTHEQAARHLGWPIGTVKSRQSRGRERLRERLVRRGHASSAGMMLAALKPKVLTTLLPPALIDETAHAAVHSLTIRTITNGSSAALAREVLRSMSLLRWWKAATFFIAAVATVSGAAVFAQKEKAKPADDPIPAAAALNPPVIVVKPGKLILAERGSLEAIPTAAVLSRGGKTVVALKTPEGGFSWREVTIGGNDMKRFEIVHGLHEGDVVVENASLLKDRNAEKDKEPSKP